MNQATDQQLLGEFARNRSDEAFAELVRRHIDLVHSAAVRMVRDPHLAQDVTQGVFVALAENAQPLIDRAVLSGWLHRTTRNLAANIVRSEVRRRVREQESAAMNETLAEGNDEVWNEIAPQLDAALEDLGEADRDAVLLRFFERKSAGEMAALLGLTEDAAQKRVSRAVARLRGLLTQRGGRVGAASVAALLSAHGVQAAPFGLAVTVSNSAVAAGTNSVIIPTSIAAKAILMTTQQKILIVAVGLLLCGTATVVLTHHSNQPTSAAESADVNVDKFVGKYEMVDHKVLLKKEGTGLAAMIDGQLAFVAYPRSESKFTSHDHNSLTELDFVRDATGRITEVTLTRDGKKLGDLKRSVTP